MRRCHSLLNKNNNGKKCSVLALKVSKQSTRGFFSVACRDVGCFFQIRAAVTSFSTLYFSYVSHPRNFIGQSARLIHRVKWRGGGRLHWVGDGTSSFFFFLRIKKVKHHRPKRYRMLVEHLISRAAS